MTGQFWFVFELTARATSLWLSSNYSFGSFLILIEGVDAMLKSANVKMVGWDKVGSGLVTAFVVGDVAAVKAAIDAGASAAAKIGEVVSVQVIPRPHEELAAVLPKPKADKGAAS